MKNFFIGLSLLLQPNFNQDSWEKAYYESLVYSDAPRGVKDSINSSVLIQSMSTTNGLSTGSGNLVKIKGHEVIITAHHVVKDGLFMIAVEKNHKTTSLELVYFDEKKDIAVLRPTEKLSVTSAIKLKQRKDNHIGKPVYHCGHPSVVEFNLSRGMITSYNRGSIIVDSFSLPGSSGSVVFGERGDVIGIVIAIAVGQWFESPELIGNIVIVTPIDYLDIQGIVEALENGTTRIESGDSDN